MICAILCSFSKFSGTAVFNKHFICTLEDVCSHAAFKHRAILIFCFCRKDIFVQLLLEVLNGNYTHKMNVSYITSWCSFYCEVRLAAWGNEVS